MVMKAEPGAELACRAYEMDIDMDGKPICRGIISYYAALTMEKATDMHSWIDLIEQISGEDLAQNTIKLHQKPMLQLCGDAHIKVIGERRLTELDKVNGS